jgi:Ca2+-binding RTX toxin-like protein
MAGSQPVVLVGTRSDDRLRGGAGDDRLIGRDGADRGDALLGLAAFDSDGNGVVDAADAAVELVTDARHGPALALDIAAAQAALVVPSKGAIAGRHVLLVVGFAVLTAAEILTCQPELG